MLSARSHQIPLLHLEIKRKVVYKLFSVKPVFSGTGNSEHGSTGNSFLIISYYLRDKLTKKQQGRQEKGFESCCPSGSFFPHRWTKHTSKQARHVFEIS